MERRNYDVYDDGIFDVFMGYGWGREGVYLRWLIKKKGGGGERGCFVVMGGV